MQGRHTSGKPDERHVMLQANGQMDAGGTSTDEDPCEDEDPYWQLRRPALRLTREWQRLLRRAATAYSLEDHHSARTLAAEAHGVRERAMAVSILCSLDTAPSLCLQEERHRACQKGLTPARWCIEPGRSCTEMMLSMLELPCIAVEPPVQIIQATPLQIIQHRSCCIGHTA